MEQEERLSALQNASPQVIKILLVVHSYYFYNANIDLSKMCQAVRKGITGC